jgi:hypothetical protein
VPVWLNYDSFSSGTVLWFLPADDYFAFPFSHHESYPAYPSSFLKLLMLQSYRMTLMQHPFMQHLLIAYYSEEIEYCDVR